MKTRLISFLCCMLIAISTVFCLGLGVLAAGTEESAGLTFTADDRYATVDALGTLPRTFSAWINVPKTKAGDMGSILSTRIDNATPCVSFGVFKLGQPQLFYITKKSNGNLVTPNMYLANADGGDIRSDDYVMMTITVEYDSTVPTNVFTYYLNGEVIGSGTTAWAYNDTLVTTPLTLSGDGREGNSSYFKGSLKDTVLYSEVLSADEVMALYENGVSGVVGKKPIAYYQIDASDLGTNIADMSGNGHHLIYSGPNKSYTGGMSFTSADDVYTMRKPLDKMPRTFEAIIKLPTEGTGNNCILGSYYSTAVQTINFEIRGGHPYMYYNNGGTAARLSFNSVAVNTGKAVRLTVVHDSDNAKLYCYVDGELIQDMDSDSIDALLTAKEITEIIPPNVFAIGSDNRSGNGQRFDDGIIYSAAFWSDARTAEEVADGTVDTSDENLICAYDFTGDVPSLADISGNGYDIGIDIAVSFNANGGAGTMNAVTGYKKGDSYTLPSCSFTAPDGQYFAGWALTAAGEPIFDAEITLDDDIVLYAVWSDIVYPGEGMAFTKEPYYILEEPLSEIPYTYYANIYIPEGLETVSAGSMLSSWFDNTDPNVTFYVDKNGTPSFTYRVASGSTNNTYVQFAAGTVPYGEWVKVAVTLAANTNGEIKLAKCCINGTMLATKTLKNNYDENAIKNPFVLGGNAAPGNTNLFKGEMKELALFSRTFTNDEMIALCTNGISDTENSVIAHYELKDVASGENIADASGNGNDLAYINRWVDMEELPADYAYSLAVVGDTQIISRDYPEKLDTIYDWIIDNKDSKKIKYVIGLGDITDDNTAAEWTAAQAAISQMNGILPYSLIRGNHETAANLNAYFANEGYMRDTMGFYAENDVNNSYEALCVGDDKYLLLNLNYTVDDGVIAWIDDVLTEYSDHKVIVSIHSFICSHDGGLLTRDHACNPSMKNVPYDSTELWEQVFSQYENMFMILCGHEATDDIMMRQEKGVHGNTVTQLLINPQYVDAYWRPSGMVAMLYFYPEKNEVTVEYYSTIQQCYFKESNRYTIKLSEETAEPGDATGDGKITPLDLISLTRYLAGWTDYTEGAKKPVLAALDLNSDGAVNFEDATVLARHIAKWIGYEELPYTK